MRRGTLVVLSGPSGVGKDTIINIITFRSSFRRFPTYTTRKSRPGEINGVHYYFVDEDTFMSLLRGGDLLDHVVIAGNHYGLPIKNFYEFLKSGQDIIISLVLGSALMLKRIIPEAILVFVLPPSHKENLARMRNREMMEWEIARRLRDDPTMLQAARFYDFIVVNYEGEEQETAERILEFVRQKCEVTPRVGLQKSREDKIMRIFPEFFATNNDNKLREVNEILGFNLKQIAIDLVEPQSVKVEDVVSEKAKDAFYKTGKLVLVEDTGLEFEAWNELPGALIKWFLATVGNEGILKMLKGETNRKAIAKTAIGFFDGTQTRISVGEIYGTIPDTIRGTGGFGWDPIFIPDGYEKSFAEMTSVEKNTISMRKLALERMKSELK
jgi:XTP/dITP diphosphohydrolase